MAQFLSATSKCLHFEGSSRIIILCHRFLPCGTFFIDYIYIYIYNIGMVKSPDQLTPLTLTKRVMAGNTTKEYLEAFQKLNPNEIPYSSLASHGFSRFHIIQLWNSLQKTPNKVRYYTFSLVHDNKIVQENIKKYYEHEKYAYILHDKDTSAEHKHFHYVLMFNSPRSFKSVANDLQIPVTMLQKVYSKKGILDYLTHENDPNKHHYDPSEITANFDIEDEKNDDGPDVLQEFKWYCDLREGRMSAQEFIERLHLCIVRHYDCIKKTVSHASFYFILEAFGWC